MALLEVESLGISFGGLRAVDNFNIKIEKEQLYGRLKDYTVLAFTSANGAELFLEGLLNQGLDVRALSHMRIGAVGEGTDQALRQRGLRADWIPRQYTTADLARRQQSRISSMRA